MATIPIAERLTPKKTQNKSINERDHDHCDSFSSIKLSHLQSLLHQIGASAFAERVSWFGQLLMVCSLDGVSLCAFDLLFADTSRLVHRHIFHRFRAIGKSGKMGENGDKDDRGIFWRYYRSKESKREKT
jgi:hypothetical protein